MGRGKRALAASEDESESSSSSSGDEQEIVNVDFDFFDPKPEDFHGVKALLRTYLHETEWDLTCFVDLILAQTTVGTVLKAGEDESPIGFVTVLNIKSHRESSAMKAIGKFLVTSTGNLELKALWNSNTNVGLLVCERFINVPVQVCGPLYEGLFEEISWATEDEPSAELRESFKFDHYLVLTRVYQEVRQKQAPKTKKSKKKAKKNVEASDGAPGELVFIKPEDELLLQLSSISCMFPVKAGALAGHETKGLKLFALVMCVEATQMEAFKTKLKDMVEEE